MLKVLSSLVCVVVMVAMIVCSSVEGREKMAQDHKRESSGGASNELRMPFIDSNNTLGFRTGISMSRLTSDFRTGGCRQEVEAPSRTSASPSPRRLTRLKSDEVYY